ncbi:flagellar protein FlaG [Aquibacillus sp. 3ASR75-11]|uniref:Flagellar protein FlaG n=1 Tax=Terrihalobacillus insolitus TaxID=2950438 RepID=A0A9X3WTD6_9BACI|nr:flagellar protein FlaG [Terrihalobacillus insolitus]MDC3412232.1 flagellar protein FlaG [Terrihalobacillus insolitus]MDC3423074.1 flagellar protein FlaG [Terrihalobacillus insolitus]
MNVGRIISESLLLQKAENTKLPTSARDRSITKVDQARDAETSNEQAIVGQSDKLDKEQVQGMVKAINDFLEPTKTALKYQFHEKLNEYYVTIINPETKEIIREIPPKKLLDVYASMAELMGFIVDEKV